MSPPPSDPPDLTWEEITEAVRQAIQRDLDELRAMPKRFAPGAGLVDDLPDYVGIPYEPKPKQD